MKDNYIIRFSLKIKMCALFLMISLNCVGVGKTIYVESIEGVVVCYDMQDVMIKTVTVARKGVNEYLSAIPTSTTGVVTIPNEVEYQGSKYRVNAIGPNAFKDCNLLTKVVLPDSLSEIHSNAFENCTSLQSVDLPKSLDRLQSSAFSGCSSLTSIYIPAKIRYISDNMFKNCASLKSIYIASDNYLTEIGEYAFYECKALDNIDFLCNKIASNGIIEDYAFYGCSGLTNVTIPNSVTRIGNSAFMRCYGLTFITIPNSVMSIGELAFNGCRSLENVVLPNNMKNIERYIFSGCKELKSITIPNSVISIGEYAFSGCLNLMLDFLPENLQVIGQGAFRNCENMKTIVIPRKVEAIELSAFSGCSNLVSVYVRNSDPIIIERNVFEDIAEKSVLYVPYSALSKYLSNKYWNNIFSNIVEEKPQIGNTFTVKVDSILYDVEIINDNPFEVDIKGSNNMALDEEYKVPNIVWGPDKKQFVVSSINSSAFDGSIMKSLIISENIKNIADAAFSNISMLESIFIPKKVEKMGLNFVLCDNLQSVTVNWRNPSEINVNTENFKEFPNSAILYVPAGTYERYASHKLWSRFSQIVEMGPISIGDVKGLPNSQFDLPIFLKNAEEIVGLQFKLTLPKGISVAENNEGFITAMTERTEGLTVIGNKDPNSENSYLFAALSLEGRPFNGNEGDIMNIKLDAVSKLALEDYEIKMEEVHMATTSFETISPLDTYSELSIVDLFDLIYVIDGVEYKRISIKNGDSIIMEKVPTKEGYTFSGWSEEPLIMPKNDLTIVGSYIPNKYQISYMLDGNVYRVDSVFYGEEIVLPDVPIKEWHNFEGWGEVPEEMPAKDLNVEGTYSIALDMGDVNGDNRISVVDITILTNRILRKENEVFIDVTADLNGDERISVIDITMLTNKIIEK